MTYFPKARAEIKRGIIKFSGGATSTITPSANYVFQLASITSKKGTLSTTIDTSSDEITIPAGTMLEVGFHVRRDALQSQQNQIDVGFYDTGASAYVGTTCRLSNYTPVDKTNGDGYCRLVNSSGSDQVVQIRIKSVVLNGDDMDFAMGDSDDTSASGVMSRIIVTEV